jgi:hypothetical protein
VVEDAELWNLRHSKKAQQYYQNFPFVHAPREKKIIFMIL